MGQGERCRARGFEVDDRQIAYHHVDHFDRSLLVGIHCHIHEGGRVIYVGLGCLHVEAIADKAELLDGSYQILHGRRFLIRNVGVIFRSAVTLNNSSFLT